MWNDAQKWQSVRSCFREISRGLLCFAIFACAPQTGSFTSECVVNSDQTGTLKGHWAFHPIPLAVQAVDFSPAELAMLQSAIDSWNSFFKESKGFALFLSGSSSLDVVSSGGARPTSRTICGTQAVNTKGFTRQLMIYKVNSGWSYGSSVIGLTSNCPSRTANAAYPSFYGGMMEINFQNFFNAGQKVPDLQSIVLHELGHLLGVDHSCSGNACASAPESYYEAVMYPSAGFNGNEGIAKRVIQLNDQQRANCLY